MIVLRDGQPYCVGIGSVVQLHARIAMAELRGETPVVLLHDLRQAEAILAGVEPPTVLPWGASKTPLFARSQSGSWSWSGSGSY